MAFPPARGPLSAWVLHRLRGADAGGPVQATPPIADLPTDAGWSDDLHLALFLCHDLHLGGFTGVDPTLEWDVALIAVRTRLEAAFVASLAAAVEASGAVESTPAGETRGAGGAGPVERCRRGTIGDLVIGMLDADDSPSLSAFVEHEASLDQMREVVVHRSAYQLAEGDFHTFAIPRMSGRAKQSLVAIQAGEYGCDAPDREMHSALYAATMRALGLDDRRHAHLAVQPASALTISNLISLFGLHRRWRGALVGQLAAFELTSVVPMGRYGRALRRMGAPDDACRFYDVHVLADAEHERWALDMVEHVVADAPELAGDIAFGVACTLEVERRFAAELFERWGRGNDREHHVAA